MARAAGGDRRRPAVSATFVLGEQLSASLRENLIEQLAAINSADEAAAWAQRNMPAKNKLMAADAKMVEERFQAKLLQIEQQLAAGETSPAPPAPAGMPEWAAPDGPAHAFPSQDQASVGAAVIPATQKAAAVGRKRY